MSNIISSNSSISSSDTRAVAAGETPMLAPEEVVEQLRALLQQIPEVSVPANVRSSLRAAHVDPAFAVAAINIIGASGEIQTPVGATREELLADQTEVARWTAAETEARVLLKRIASVILVRRHRIGLAALRAYGVGQQLVRNGEHETLQTHIDGMKRMRKFSRRRAKAPLPPEQPAPPQPQQK